MNREVAWRIFANEYNDSTFEIKGEEEKIPSYVVTPLGAKVNRLYIVGVLTDVENISDDGDLIRAHVSDPTGVFTLYSSQYQKDATDTLLDIEVPAFVAIVGKSRTYIPEEGSLYVSVRPEIVRTVASDVRDQWILETCKSTKERIEAFNEAKKMNEANAFEIRKLGYSIGLSEGIVCALKNYEHTDVSKYLALIKESMEFLKPRTDKPSDLTTTPDMIKDINVDVEKKNNKKTSHDNKKDDDFQEKENTVFTIIKEIEGKNGASWDLITEKSKKLGIDKDSTEEVLNSLMEKGLIYEPVLGLIKVT